MTGRSRFASRAVQAVALCLAVLLVGCATSPPAPEVGLVDLMDRPAERALYEGIRAYDDGQFAQAEVQLRKSVGMGLRNGRDRATAHKLLAFITCTSDRMAECEAHFRVARAADPRFALTRSEAGHPQWGPVYRRTQP